MASMYSSFLGTPFGFSPTPVLLASAQGAGAAGLGAGFNPASAATASPYQAPYHAAYQNPYAVTPPVIPGANPYLPPQPVGANLNDLQSLFVEKNTGLNVPMGGQPVTGGDQKTFDLFKQFSADLNHDGQLTRKELDGYIKGDFARVRQLDINPTTGQAAMKEIGPEERELAAARLLRDYFDAFAGQKGKADAITADEVAMVASIDGNPYHVSQQDITVGDRIAFQNNPLGYTPEQLELQKAQLIHEYADLNHDGHVEKRELLEYQQALLNLQDQIMAQAQRNPYDPKLQQLQKVIVGRQEAVAFFNAHFDEMSAQDGFGQSMSQGDVMATHQRSGAAGYLTEQAFQYQPPQPYGFYGNPYSNPYASPSYTTANPGYMSAGGYLYDGVPETSL